MTKRSILAGVLLAACLGAAQMNNTAGGSTTPSARIPSHVGIVPKKLRSAAASDAAQMSYLDNGVIRLGVDLNMGGVITYLSRSSDSYNVINSFDLGREINQSYYSGPTPYGNPSPDWPNWPWNANGAGDTYGNRGQVIASSNDGARIYVRSIPMQWALDNVPCECFFETWITLDGNAANLRFRLTNHRVDLTQYDSYPQELPAVYTIGKLHRLITYDGAAPFTDAPLSELIPREPDSYRSYTPSENWMALVDDSGWGLGVLNTDVYSFTAFFAGTPNTGGPADDPTGHISPSRPETLDHNITYDYEASLILGTISEIRTYAVAHRRHEARPDHHFGGDHFQEDRQHISYGNARDQGLPFKGPLRVKLDQAHPQIFLQGWWEARSLPVLYINAAFHTHDAAAEIFWSIPGEEFSASRSLGGFPVIPDGQFHTYAVDLAASPAYTGIITGLRFDPSDGGIPGDYVDIASISFRRDDARLPRVVVRPQ